MFRPRTIVVVSRPFLPPSLSLCLFLSPSYSLPPLTLSISLSLSLPFFSLPLSPLPPSFLTLSLSPLRPLPLSPLLPLCLSPLLSLSRRLAAGVGGGFEAAQVYYAEGCDISPQRREGQGGAK